MGKKWKKNVMPYCLLFSFLVANKHQLLSVQYHIEEDKKAVCFICSTPSHEFERRAMVSLISWDACEVYF